MESIKCKVVIEGKSFKAIIKEVVSSNDLTDTFIVEVNKVALNDPSTHYFLDSFTDWLPSAIIIDNNAKSFIPSNDLFNMYCHYLNQVGDTDKKYPSTRLFKKMMISNEGIEYKIKNYEGRTQRGFCGIKYQE